MMIPSAVKTELIIGAAVYPGIIHRDITEEADDTPRTSLFISGGEGIAVESESLSAAEFTLPVTGKSAGSAETQVGEQSEADGDLRINWTGVSEVEGSATQSMMPLMKDFKPPPPPLSVVDFDSSMLAVLGWLLMIWW
jgi:hypothetical protein